MRQSDYLSKFCLVFYGHFRDLLGLMLKHQASNSTLIYDEMFGRNHDAQYGFGVHYYANPLQSTIYLCDCEWLCVSTYHLELNLLVGDITWTFSSPLWRSEQSASETRRKIRQNLSMNRRNLMSVQKMIVFRPLQMDELQATLNNHFQIWIQISSHEVVSASALIEWQIHYNYYCKALWRCSTEPMERSPY